MELNSVFKKGSQKVENIQALIERSKLFIDLIIDPFFIAD